jgi:hypothetical protein
MRVICSTVIFTLEARSGGIGYFMPVPPPFTTHSGLINRKVSARAN